MPAGNRRCAGPWSAGRSHERHAARPAAAPSRHPAAPQRARDLLAKLAARTDAAGGAAFRARPGRTFGALPLPGRIFHPARLRLLRARPARPRPQRRAAGARHRASTTTTPTSAWCCARCASATPGCRSCWPAIRWAAWWCCASCCSHSHEVQAAIVSSPVLAAHPSARPPAHLVRDRQVPLGGLAHPALQDQARRHRHLERPGGGRRLPERPAGLEQGFGPLVHRRSWPPRPTSSPAPATCERPCS